jgi:hypothetical protein
MTCNKQLGAKLRVRNCNNTSKEKINRIRGQSKFVYIAAAPLPRMPITFSDKSRNSQLITFQLLRTSHNFFLQNTKFHYCVCKSPSLVSILK